jgi:hypothetical protein
MWARISQFTIYNLVIIFLVFHLLPIAPPCSLAGLPIVYYVQGPKALWLKGWHKLMQLDLHHVFKFILGEQGPWVAWPSPKCCCFVVRKVRKV